MTKKPKMILFDYGQTLIVEPQFDWTAANLAILSHTSGLPEGMSEEEFCNRSNELFEYVSDSRRESCREIEHEKFIRLLRDAYGLKFDISISEADLLYWYSATHGSFASPGAADFLEYLHENGIRTGVISNMCYSNMALRTRLNRYLPNNRFDFVSQAPTISSASPKKCFSMWQGFAPDLTPMKYGMSATTQMQILSVLSVRECTLCFIPARICAITQICLHFPLTEQIASMSLKKS